MHSNGFSLVRKVFDVNEVNLKVYVDELGMTLGEALLTPTKIYVKPLLALMQAVEVRAVSHITGGGFYENIPRMLSGSVNAVVEKAAVRVLPVFDVLKVRGGIPERDMYNTFNMGVGLMCVVPADQADEAVRVLTDAGETAYIVGEIAEGDGSVILK